MNTTCVTPGCFNTAYESKLCSQCLDDVTPLKRGPVKINELLRAKAIGGIDLEIIKQRLALHGQPDNGLC